MCKRSLLHAPSTPLRCSYVALIAARLFVLRAARVPMHQTAAPSPTSAAPRLPPDRLQRTHCSCCLHFCSSNGYTGPVHGKCHVSHAAAQHISTAAAGVRAGGMSGCLHCCVLTRVLLLLLVHATCAGTSAMHVALSSCLRAGATRVHKRLLCAACFFPCSLVLLQLDSDTASRSPLHHYALQCSAQSYTINICNLSSLFNRETQSKSARPASGRSAAKG